MRVVGSVQRQRPQDQVEDDSDPPYECEHQEARPNVQIDDSETVADPAGKTGDQTTLLPP